MEKQEAVNPSILERISEADIEEWLVAKMAPATPPTNAPAK